MEDVTTTLASPFFKQQYIEKKPLKGVKPQNFPQTPESVLKPGERFLQCGNWRKFNSNFRRVSENMRGKEKLAVVDNH